MESESAAAAAAIISGIMPSERIQRRIDAFLDEADEAASADEWGLVASKSRAVLAIEAENEDAAAFLQMALANGVAAEAGISAASAVRAGGTTIAAPRRAAASYTAISS